MLLVHTAYQKRPSVDVDSPLVFVFRPVSAVNAVLSRGAVHVR